MLSQQFQVVDRQVHCALEPAQAITVSLKLQGRIACQDRGDSTV